MCGNPHPSDHLVVYLHEMVVMHGYPDILVSLEGSVENSNLVFVALLHILLVPQLLGLCYSLPSRRHDEYAIFLILEGSAAYYLQFFNNNV